MPLSTNYRFDPTRDPRWSRFVQTHAAASVFHTAEWLEALRRTYGFEPIVITYSAPDRELSNGIVCCRVRSWLTGQRIVSLPFSDHCEPLVEGDEALADLLSGVETELSSGSTYIEIRGVAGGARS